VAVAALIQALHLMVTAQPVVQVAVVEQPKALTMLVVQLLHQVKAMLVERVLETLQEMLFMVPVAVVVRVVQGQTQHLILVVRVELAHQVIHLGV
jgi:hypothetical protein